MKSYTKPSSETLKRELDPLSYRVTQEDATEPPFQNAYWNHHEDGIYVDVVSGEPLFASLHKYDSGSGWPSFTQALEPDHLVTHEDRTLGMRRVELRSKHANSHLGHVFDDGPAPTGQRYCINSAALRFIPVAELEAKGYGQYVSLFTAAKKGITSAPSPKAQMSTTQAHAVLAGGCFWGMEDLFRAVPGVLDTEVGYAGGALANPTYPQVKTGQTGHAEVLRVTYDPSKLSYEDLLRFFFSIHDPTTLNRQGNDIGSQYRSAIFVASDTEREAAKRIISEVQVKWPKPIVTTLEPAAPFYPAEDYHQDYLVKNPGGYTCHFARYEALPKP